MQPLAAGPALAAGLDGRSARVQAVAGVGLWAVWALTLLASAILAPIGLTVLRLVAPAALGASVVAAVGGRPGAAATAGAVAAAVAAVAVVFAPATGVAFVNGPAYPNERRFPLRPPGPVLLGPLPVAWAVIVGAPIAATLLAAARAWMLAAAVAVVGLPLAALLARAVHGLSRRWVVFVPAGLVLADPATLVDPVLFLSEVVERLGPAPADTDALDLTLAAPGLALELRLREKVPMILARGRKEAEPGSSARLLFTPTRAASVLAEAAARGLTVG